MAVAADEECSDKFFAGIGECHCVRKGEMCQQHATTENIAIYRTEEANTRALHSAKIITKHEEIQKSIGP